MSGTKLEQELREAISLAGLSPRTTYIYVRKLQQIDEWLNERDVGLDDATPTDVATYATTIPAGRSTRMQYRAALKHYYAATERNPAPYTAIPIPRKRRGTCRALSASASTRLYRTAVTWEAGPEGLATLLGMMMALRRFEIGQLRWSDFSADGMLTVRGKGGLIADIPVHPVVAERMEWWRNVEQHTDRTDMRCRPGKTYLFPGRGYTERGHVTPNTIWKWVDTVSEAAGLGHVQTHVLRHTALALANDATGDLRAVQDLARHLDPEQTALYTRVTKDRMQKVMLAINYDCGDETP